MTQTLNRAPALDALEEARRVAEDAIAAHNAYVEESLPTVVAVADAIYDALSGGHKILLFGNGGSAADAQHVAGELVGRFLKESEPWPAIALTTDSSILTCVGTDWDFADVFARQVRAHVKPGDVVAGITTSGTSPNVIRALADAKARGAVTVGFTGRKGDCMREQVDICFAAPSSLTPRVQELHLLAWHTVCEIVEERMLRSAEAAG